ncbi:MAG TPA: S8 family serine peptidase [Micromonosporaceae bacterium]
MSKHDRALLATAIANGDQEVTLLIASWPGVNGSVVAGLRELGATVRYREDDISYLRAVTPTGKVEQVVRLSGVRSVNLDEVIPLDDPRPDGSVNPIPQPPPGADTPVDNPYLPIGDTGSAQFTAAYPQHDGRGVKVGILDTGIDLRHPALARTTTGERKVIDWVTYTDPATDNDPTWIAMSTQVSGPSFSAGGVDYTAPGAGNYRFGRLNERDPRLGGELGNDVNRDGNPAGSSGTFGVLWDGADTVWVDTDQDRSFADESAMRDYQTAYDVGEFGSDDPATALREQIPFVVQVSGRDKAVNIGIVSGAHGSHVAGIVAGNELFGGRMKGAAPGAQIVSVRVCLFVAGCTSHGLVEGMVYAAKQSDVDVINMSIGGLPSLNDGDNTTAILYNRLIERYGVQMFIAAGNSGPGMNTVGDPSVASDVVSVGSYLSDATWAANYGSSAPSPGGDNLHPFSSRGPREDGGFKPTLIASGSAISTIPMWQPGGPVAGTYPLPPGYAMFNGTSMATPQAAGAATLLVGAAKAEGFQHQPAQLRQALTSTARFIDGYQAYEQGHGLIDVRTAYSQLRTNLKPVRISSRVPVNTALSGFLTEPGVGVGIHDREGVTAGESYTRRYTFTRTSGGSQPVGYRLSWKGNDGTFAAPSSVSLPLNQPVEVPVQVTPDAVGEHSALLRLDDPDTVGVDYATMNVVVVPHRFTAADNHRVTVIGEVARNQANHYFFQVPSGVPALKVDLSGPSATPGTGQARFLRYHPYGVPIDSNSSLSCFSPPVTGGSCGGTPLSRTTANPTAGVWEIVVEARRTSDTDVTPFTLTVSILGASVSPNPDVIASATAGVPISRSYTLRNLYGEFTGRAVGTTLGSARTGRFSIDHLEMRQYPVTVTAGSTSLRATIGNPSDPGADLDLYLYNCTSGSCRLVRQSADGDSEESVTVNNPAAGAWLVLIDGYAVPEGTTDYDHLDVFTNPGFGSVSVTDANAVRVPDAEWTVPGAVTADQAPATGRVLLGSVQVRTDGNVLIGSNNVIVESVT